MEVINQVTFPGLKWAYRGSYFDTHIEKTRPFLFSHPDRLPASHNAKSCCEGSAAAV